MKPNIKTTRDTIGDSIQKILRIRDIIKDIPGESIKEKCTLATWTFNFLYAYQHEIFDEINEKQKYVTTQLSNLKGSRSWKEHIFKEADEGINNLNSLIRDLDEKELIKEILKPEIKALRREVKELRTVVDKAKESKKRPSTEVAELSASTVKKKKISFDVLD